MAHFLIQQQVHQVADHQRARGFIGQKRIQQRPVGDGTVLLGALGNGCHAHQVVGFEHHAAGPHAAIGQGHRPDEVQRGMQRGGQRQHVFVGGGQHEAKRAGGPSGGGRGHFHGQRAGGKVGVQHIHPPRQANFRRRGHESRCRLGFSPAGLGRNGGLREHRARIRLPREVEHHGRHRRKAAGRFGRGAGIAFVHHQVGGQAQGLHLDA